MVERLRRAYRMGLTLAFGSDVFFTSPGMTRGQTAISYIDSAVEAGLGPRAILEQMIPNSARLLGVEKQRGAVRAGLAADLIATRSSPLQDIRALRSVFFVMKDGRVIRDQR